MKESIKKIIKKLNKNNILLYSLPLFIVFFIVLLAYYPGIMVSDGVYQWDLIKKGTIDDWHPAYNTIYIMLLTLI